MGDMMVTDRCLKVNNYNAMNNKRSNSPDKEEKSKNTFNSAITTYDSVKHNNNVQPIDISDRIGIWLVLGWSKTFGGNISDMAYSVQQTSDGGYILAGETWSFGAASEDDAWLIKTDALGNEEWSKTFSADYAYSVQQTTDGGYIVAGSGWSVDWDPYPFAHYNAWLLKTDAFGNEMWSKTFGGDEYDEAYSVQQTTDGGYIMAGYTWSFGAPYGDFWLIKTDACGNEEWNKTFGGYTTDEAYSVQQTTDGGYIMAGITWSFGAGKDDAWLIKTDAFGNEEWSQTFGGNSWDKAYSVRQTTDGGYIVVGETHSFSAEEYNEDAWLIKTDAFGNEEWSRTSGKSDEDYAYSVQQTTDGGYILAGGAEPSDTWKNDAWLIKTDAFGNEEWSRTFGGDEWDEAFSIQQTTDGGYIVAGKTASYGAGESDAWLIKTDVNGYILLKVKRPFFSKEKP